MYIRAEYRYFLEVLLGNVKKKNLEQLGFQL